MIRFTVFDRWGNQTGVVNDVMEAVHTDEVNGEDSLTLTLASCNLTKGDRIVWRDKFGTWHEHTVNDLKDVHEDGKLYSTVYCENSIAELYTDYIEELRPYDTSAYTALQKALSVTRWSIGAVDVSGTSSASFYHISAREAIASIIEAWGGELSTTIKVSGTSVADRMVNITAKRGGDYGKRFEWTKDLEGITREVSTDDVVTALYGYGKGLEAYDEDGNATGGYERKLTFGDINDGLDYVADEDAKLTWGLPDGNGGIKHTFGKVEFDDCEDMEELLQLTKDELETLSKPQVTYTGNVIDLADAGFSSEDVQSGDAVAIIDGELGERLSGRVLSVERYLYSEQSTVITLGNVSRSIADVISATQSTVSSLSSHSSAWDGAASISAAYINGMINSLNATINAIGGYTYYVPGEGLITYDKPEGESPTMAIQIKGGSFRIANSKTSDGDWNWRTFGTGDGFTADEINAGTLNAALVKAGVLSDVAGKNYWNFETGEFSLSANASLGDSEVGSVVVSTDVQYGVSDDADTEPDSWTTTVLWQQGKHLWTRMEMTLADGTVEYSAARRIANSSGIGASEVIEQYYLSTSSTTQTGGSWTAAQPKWVEGRYYWTRSRITWSDGTITYTDPVLARALTSGNQSTDDLDESLTQEEVFNRLTNDGETQGIYLSGDKLYINADYIKSGTIIGDLIKAGVITSADGNSSWDLDNGIFQTTALYDGDYKTMSLTEEGTVLYETGNTVAEFLADYVALAMNKAKATIKMGSEGAKIYTSDDYLGGGFHFRPPDGNFEDGLTKIVGENISDGIGGTFDLSGIVYSSVEIYNSSKGREGYLGFMPYGITTGCPFSAFRYVEVYFTAFTSGYPFCNRFYSGKSSSLNAMLTASAAASDGSAIWTVAVPIAFSGYKWSLGDGLLAVNDATTTQTGTVTIDSIVGII